MKVSTLARGLLVAGFLVAMPAAAADFKLTKQAMVYNGGQRYFRGNASQVRLGSYGEKKAPINQPNYLAVQNHITQSNLAKVRVDIGQPEAIDWSKYSKTDVEASGSSSYVKNTGATGSFSQESAKSAKLVLVKMSLTEGELKKVLNNYADGARKYLAGEGSDGRVVSTIWVVMEAQLASQVQTSSSVTATGTVNGIELEVKASNTTATTTKVTIPPGATFAYGMHKVKSWGKNKESIEDLEDDQTGLN